MPVTNILVVVIDGLRASALGAYGNTSFPTPGLDQFAAESFLLDWCYAPSADLTAIYRALWQSLHPARLLASTGSEAGAHSPLSLPTFFASRGYHTAFATDDPQLLSFAGAADFHECVEVADSPRGVAQVARAPDVSQTQLARLFAAAGEVVTAPPQLVWVHSRGMYGPWDAPLELQQLLLDEDDPPPVEEVAPPDLWMGPDDDPDSAFRYACAYAAQAMVLDSCLASLLDALDKSGGDDSWLVMLIGGRGFPLGEHRSVGGVDSRLYAEQLHVPWLIRFPERRGRLARSGQLVSHLDVVPTLVGCLDGDTGPALPSIDGMSILPLATASRRTWRDALLSVSSESTRAIRTASWCLREDAATNDDDGTSHDLTSPPAELYVRPDDRWEANDIAKLCRDVVEELHSATNNALQRISHGEAMPHVILPIEAGAPKT